MKKPTKKHICGNCIHATREPYIYYHGEYPDGYTVKSERDACKEGHDPRKDCWHKVSKQPEKILKYL